MGTLTAAATNAMFAVNNAMMRVLLDGTGGEGGGGGTGKFDLITFLDNAAGYLKKVGHYIMVLAGVILVIVAVVQIAKGLAGGGRGQVNWVMSITCLLVGGMLIFGGWNLATGLASMGADTITELGGGTAGTVGIGEDGGSSAGQSGFSAAGGGTE